MASLRSWWDFVSVAKPRVNTSGGIVRESVGSRVNLNQLTQGFDACDVPRGRAKIDHTYKRVWHAGE